MPAISEKTQSQDGYNDDDLLFWCICSILAI